MKIIRVAALAIALCAASASIAAAQRPDSGPVRRRGGMMGGRLLEGITLTEAQQAQVKVIREKYMPKLQELRQTIMATGGPPDSATRAKMTEISAAQMTEVRAILTSDQVKVLDRNIAEEKERRGRMNSPPGN